MTTALLTWADAKTPQAMEALARDPEAFAWIALALRRDAFEVALSFCMAPPLVLVTTAAHLRFRKRLALAEAVQGLAFSISEELTSEARSEAMTAAAVASGEFVSLDYLVRAADATHEAWRTRARRRWYVALSGIA